MRRDDPVLNPIMEKNVNKLARIASLLAFLLAVCLIQSPARAQSAGYGGDGDDDMMTTMAPVLNVMKRKLGKRRFTRLMQTVGPMIENDGGEGGFGGGYRGGYGGYGLGGGGFNFGGFDLGGIGQYITPDTVSSVVSLALSSGGHHRRGRRLRRHY
jgi:uncharacterized membrane protein YgcG